MCRRLYRFLSGEDAATAVEYAVMLGLVLMAVFAAVATLGQNTSQSWSNSNASLKAVNFGS